MIYGYNATNIIIYRVTQNKVSHQTKSNFSATIGVFYIKISGFMWEIF